MHSPWKLQVNGVGLNGKVAFPKRAHTNWQKKGGDVVGVIQGVRGTHGRTTEEPRRTARGYTFFLLFSVSVTRGK